LNKQIQVFFISLLVFSVGISMGIFLTNYKVDSASENLQLLKTSLSDILLFSTYPKEIPCNIQEEFIKDMDGAMIPLWDKVVSMEEEGIFNREYYSLKKELIETRLRYWVISENIRKNCNLNITTILQIYNTEEECKLCANQGYVLEHLKYMAGNGYLIISPIDIDEDIPMIDLTLDVFNITEVPSIIIDGEIVFSGFTPEAQLKSFICEKYNNSLEMC